MEMLSNFNEKVVCVNCNEDFKSNKELKEHRNYCESIGRFFTSY